MNDQMKAESDALRRRVDRHFLAARPGSPNDEFRTQIHAAFDRMVVAEAIVATVRGLVDMYAEEQHSDECGMGSCVRCVVDEFANRVITPGEAG